MVSSVSRNIIRNDIDKLEKLVELCDSSVVLQTIMIKNETDIALVDRIIDNREHSRFMDELNTQARYFQRFCSCKSSR